MNKIILVGNPNTGKTTLFNTLTHSFEHVGNWQGVTVADKQKKVRIRGKEYIFVDLPGTFSLCPFTDEEKVTVDYLLNQKYDKVFNIVDCDNLKRNLYMSLQLQEKGINTVLVINSTIKKAKLDIDKFNQISCFSAYQMSAKSKEDIDNLLAFASVPKSIPYLKDKLVLSVAMTVENSAKKNNINPILLAVNLLEQNLSFELQKSEMIQIQKLLKNINSVEYIARLRYDYISEILSKCYVPCVFAESKLDNIFLNKYLALPIFFVLFFLMFFVTFSSFGQFLSEALKNFTNIIFSPLMKWIDGVAPNWVSQLFATAVVGGVGGLLSFLPQIAMLFLCLTILEDSGYMSRIAFFFDDLLGRIGLNGKSIFSLLMGFGCSTTAVLTSRNLEGNSHIKTAMLTPFMSCSAKLPLFIIMCTAFFGGNFAIIFLLYLINIIIAIIISIFLNKKYPHTPAFIMEFAPYRRPSIILLLRSLYKNCKQFITRVGLLLMSLSVIVWILQNFSFSLKYTTNGSMLQQMGQFISPILAPIGLNNWGIGASLITGIIAKEMIVSSIAIINGVPNGNNFNLAVGSSLVAGSIITFDTLTAFVFMLFVLFYMPCISTISVLKKEVGLKSTILAIIIQFTSCYLLCFVVYNLAKLIKIYKWATIFIIIGGIIIIASISYLVFRKNKCTHNCNNCDLKCRYK